MKEKKFAARNLSMLIDFYELTMANGYFQSGRKDTIAVFDMFFRKIPDNGGFAIFAGLEQLIDYMKNLEFDAEDIAYLRGRGIFCEEFLDYLANFHFECDVWAVPEGTPVFPNEPMVIVRGPVVQAQLLETMLLLTINHQSLIATKANRIARAAHGRAVMEFGSRRAQGYDGAIYGALGGQAGAGAMVDVLTGKINPSGKLAETWANAHADTPAKDNFAGAGRTVQYREGLYVGYRYYQTAGVPVAFPFGYGLSYTSFAYSELKADARSVTLTVTNTGSRAGAEIVQVYAAKPDAQIFRPAQELKAFTKVWLEAGESKTVTLLLDDKAFRYWNTKTDSWEVEGGTYELRVGASSADIRLTAAVEVNGTSAPNPYAGKALPHYTSGKVQRVPDDEWETLLGRPIPADTVKIDRNMTLGELNHSRSPLCWLVWAVLTMMLNASYKRGKPNLNVMFQYNMPLRALAKMTSGAISMGMVDGIVLEAKGFWVIGLLKVIVEAVKNIILNAQLESRLRNS